MTVAKKPAEVRPITVRLQPSVFAELAERAGEERGEGLPSVAQMAIARYLEVVRREVPLLSEQQWHVIRDALNGVWLEEELGGPSSVAFVNSQIEDAIRLSRLDRKHDCDGAVLIAAMTSWTYANKLAVVDAVERWWRDSE
jgi:hypothetical protein